MALQGFNGKVRLVDLPNGVYTNIVATGPCRRMFIRESYLTSGGGANVPVGVNYQLPNDNSGSGFATAFLLPVPSASNPNPSIDLSNIISQYGPYGEMIGNVGQIVNGVLQTAATVTKLQPASATTTVEVWEWY